MHNAHSSEENFENLEIAQAVDKLYCLKLINDKMSNLFPDSVGGESCCQGKKLLENP
jgi:hypothetical protein